MWGELLRRRLGLAGEDRARLGLELGHGLGARAGRGLVAGHDDALQAEGAMQRLEDDDQQDRRAVRVGDDRGTPRDLLRVDLGDDERDPVDHAERARVVDDDRAPLDRPRGPLLRDARARGEEDHVAAPEPLRVEGLDRVLLAAPRELLAGRAGRGEEAQLVDGVAALLHDREELVPDGPRGPDDPDLVRHVASGPQYGRRAAALANPRAMLPPCSTSARTRC
jgi:hypothetical protein